MKLVIQSDLVKSLNPELFLTTVYTQPGKVNKLGIGRFGARQVIFDNGVKSILKQKLFSNQNFRGIKKDTQYLREVAVYQLDSQLLHFNVVPPTTITMYKEIPASIQGWVTGFFAKELVPDVFNAQKKDWKSRVAKFTAKIAASELRKVVLLDLIVNNTDRHAKNCLFDTFAHRVYAIDNGLCFGTNYRRYYSVFHKYIYRKNLELTSDEKELLSAISIPQLSNILGKYLSLHEIEETYYRIQWMLSQPNLAFEIISKGNDGKNDFPDYAEYFESKLKPVQNKMLAQISEMGRLSNFYA